MKTRIFLISIGFLVLGTGCLTVSAQTRIRFARGRTSATISGVVGPAAAKSFVLGARNGQSLSANVSSRSGCVKFDNGATSISFITNAGDNFLRVKNSCGRSTTFSLTVSINYGSN